MPIPTEPIGSLPRPRALILALQDTTTTAERLNALIEDATREIIKEFEATGSPVITDGEQGKIMSFASYSIHGAKNLGPGRTFLTFSDGHVRRLPSLRSGPFRYETYADRFLDVARRLTRTPLKQAVISASALSLIYPLEELPGYSREAFIADLVAEAEQDIRRCLAKGAHTVQIDFTEGRMAIKLDPSKELLRTFIELNNQVLDRFTPEERRRIGVHTCPGSDRALTHSADADYALLLPDLLTLKAGSFYVALAGEPDRERVLRVLKEHLKPDQRAYLGVINPMSPRIETPAEVCDQVLKAADYIPLAQLGTADDCGFAPFADDTSRTREAAFAKIRARVEGTALAAGKLGV
jgi:5-methyltetrahydropteroyltriglutamate--homocysteine methyltransferase